MLRFASSSSAIRAIATSRILSASANVNSFTASHHKSVTTSRNFSADVTKSTVHHRLTFPAAPADFPFAVFEKDHRKEEEEDEAAYMRRDDINGEKIEVRINMPKIIREDFSSDGCIPQPLSLSVRIVKENRKEVFIGFTICPHFLHANHMIVGEPAPQSHDKVIGFGTHQVDRKEEGELQCAVQEYLKIRGLRPCYAEFMYRYMVWKSKEGPLQMLDKMKKFIKDS